jgi:hypothetical protein
MNYHTLAVSILALGLLAPVGAMADNNNCSEDQMNRKLYADCIASTGNNTEQFGAAVLTDDSLGTDENQTGNGLGDSEDN